MDLPSLRRETNYGMPAADHIMFNRFFVVGYSYYFRQAKWALEIVDSGASDSERKDNFRPDYRIPSMFRADLVDYVRSGYDRGHLVASANQRESQLENSETFLLSNMSPQAPKFNQGIWRELEAEVRRLNDKKSILETFVLTGPIFYFDKTVKVIGSSDKNGVSIPVPHAYFKSILVETSKGRHYMWSFILPNKGSNEDLSSFQVPTSKVEQYAGIRLWDRLEGKKIETEKQKVRKFW